MVDCKGKGIWYGEEDDDEPILLEEQADEEQINEHRLSLIGKVLNPFKHSVPKLIDYVLTQWNMADRITSLELGNGRFLFNFINKDGLNAVLKMGPFNYNFSNFVLVRWEPVVDEDYPWSISFWVEPIGV